MREVIVIGDSNVDLVVHYPQVNSVESARQVKWEYPEVACGGTAFNTAAALGRLGVPCHLITTVGDDPNGKAVVEGLQAAGVDTDGVIVNPELTTVTVFAFIDDQGERYLWGWPRQHQSFLEIDEKKIDFDRVRTAGWVHTSGMSLVHDSSARKTIEMVLREAHEAGVPTSLDLNLRVDNGVLDQEFAHVIEGMLDNVSCLFGSGPDEYAYLGSEDWMGNARRLATKSRIIVARSGAAGSIVFSDNDQCVVPAFDVPVKDTVGAGDVFNAGFIGALLNGQSLFEALRWGNAVSGYSVAHTGASTTPSKQALLQFIDSAEYRQEVIQEEC
ncbi:sugar kinase [Collinsella sp. AGMB00827]|uniref:Sugar kinase n=1 Tax=Collinsella ureilytica TaxID=2869515 RepID=A0ABS7MI52_9ACTN|nr:sugar kinase [Collinsella urealyticum]MBY4797052.1 sugar kinase [Collinsella urealyticum]